MAQVVHFYFVKDRLFDVAAFVVDDAYLRSDRLCGLPLVPFSKMREAYPPEKFRAFVAIGYARMNKAREEKYLALKQLGYEMVSYVSPHATCFTEKIGDNCLILEDNTIQPFVEIGNNVILWSGNHVGHHSRIHDHCFIASQVVISGGVTIENNCFIGVNATIRDHITVRRETLVSAGALVTKNTQAKSVLKAEDARCSTITSDRLRNI
jgi:sugar O-acyltransferase (sialic acid O-acetyltransferase NeuD family)